MNKTTFLNSISIVLCCFIVSCINPTTENTSEPTATPTPSSAFNLELEDLDSQIPFPTMFLDIDTCNSTNPVKAEACRNRKRFEVQKDSCIDQIEPINLHGMRLKRFPTIGSNVQDTQIPVSSDSGSLRGDFQFGQFVKSRRYGSYISFYFSANRVSRFVQDERGINTIRRDESNQSTEWLLPEDLKIVDIQELVNPLRLSMTLSLKDNSTMTAVFYPSSSVSERDLVKEFIFNLIPLYDVEINGLCKQQYYKASLLGSPVNSITPEQISALIGGLAQPRGSWNRSSQKVQRCSPSLNRQDQRGSRETKPYLRELKPVVTGEASTEQDCECISGLKQVVLDYGSQSDDGESRIDQLALQEAISKCSLDNVGEAPLSGAVQGQESCQWKDGTKLDRCWSTTDQHGWKTRHCWSDATWADVCKNDCCESRNADGKKTFVCEKNIKKPPKSVAGNPAARAAEDAAAMAQAIGNIQQWADFAKIKDKFCGKAQECCKSKWNVGKTYCNRPEEPVSNQAPWNDDTWNQIKNSVCSEPEFCIDKTVDPMGQFIPTKKKCDLSKCIQAQADAANPGAPQKLNDQLTDLASNWVCDDPVAQLKCQNEKCRNPSTDELLFKYTAIAGHFDANTCQSNATATELKNFIEMCGANTTCESASPRVSASGSPTPSESPQPKVSASGSPTPSKSLKEQPLPSSSRSPSMIESSPYYNEEKNQCEQAEGPSPVFLEKYANAFESVSLHGDSSDKLTTEKVSTASESTIEPRDYNPLIGTSLNSPVGISVTGEPIFTDSDLAEAEHMGLSSESAKSYAKLQATIRRAEEIKIDSQLSASQKSTELEKIKEIVQADYKTFMDSLSTEEKEKLLKSYQNYAESEFNEASEDDLIFKYDTRKLSEGIESLNENIKAFSARKMSTTTTILDGFVTSAMELSKNCKLFGKCAWAVVKGAISHIPIVGGRIVGSQEETLEAVADPQLDPKTIGKFGSNVATRSAIEREQLEQIEAQKNEITQMYHRLKDRLTSDPSPESKKKLELLEYNFKVVLDQMNANLQELYAAEAQTYTTAMNTYKKIFDISTYVAMMTVARQAGPVFSAAGTASLDKAIEETYNIAIAGLETIILNHFSINDSSFSDRFIESWSSLKFDDKNQYFATGFFSAGYKKWIAKTPLGDKLNKGERVFKYLSALKTITGLGKDLSMGSKELYEAYKNYQDKRTEDSKKHFIQTLVKYGKLTKDAFKKDNRKSLSLSKDVDAGTAFGKTILSAEDVEKIAKTFELDISSLSEAELNEITNNKELNDKFYINKNVMEDWFLKELSTRALERVSAQHAEDSENRTELKFLFEQFYRPAMPIEESILVQINNDINLNPESRGEYEYLNLGGNRLGFGVAKIPAGRVLRPGISIQQTSYFYWYGMADRCLIRQKIEKERVKRFTASLQKRKKLFENFANVRLQQHATVLEDLLQKIPSNTSMTQEEYWKLSAIETESTVLSTILSEQAALFAFNIVALARLQNDLDTLAYCVTEGTRNSNEHLGTLFDEAMKTWNSTSFSSRGPINPSQDTRDHFTELKRGLESGYPVIKNRYRHLLPDSVFTRAQIQLEKRLAYQLSSRLERSYKIKKTCSTSSNCCHSFYDYNFQLKQCQLKPYSTPIPSPPLGQVPSIYDALFKEKEYRN